MPIGTHEWYAREVPEYYQEAPFFVEHIPRLGNAFLALTATRKVDSARSQKTVRHWETPYHAFKYSHVAKHMNAMFCAERRVSTQL